MENQWKVFWNFLLILTGTWIFSSQAPVSQGYCLSVEINLDQPKLTSNQLGSFTSLLVYEVSNEIHFFYQNKNEWIILLIETRFFF